jgi:hypothetical protein
MSFNSYLLNQTLRIVLYLLYMFPMVGLHMFCFMLIILILVNKYCSHPIRLTPPVILVSHNGLTGGVSCCRFGNGDTGLTGGPDRSDRWA